MTEPDERLSWPTRAQVALKLGIDVNKVRRLEKRGDLDAVMVGGAYRFDPAQLDAIGESGSEQIDALMAQNEKLLSHIEKLVSNTHAPATALHKLLLETVASQAARITELEKLHTESVQLRETMLSDQHARDLAQREFEAAEKRKQVAFDALMGAAPELKTQLLATLKAKSAKAEGAIGGIAKLVASLTDEQIMRLTEILRPEQLEELAQLKTMNGAAS
jgi:hypothetical protein